MMMMTKTSSTTNISVVPIRSRANVRRLMVVLSWQRGVLLPMADELNQDVDLRLVEHRRGDRHLLVASGIVREVGSDPTPVGHHAAVVLEVREAVLDAALVIVLVEETEPVLVVQRRPDSPLALATVTLRAALVVERGALSEGVHGVDDQIGVRAV